MPIRFPCPKLDCGKFITVKDEHAGKTGKCPACQTPVKVPLAPPTTAQAETPKPKPVVPPTPPPVAATVQKQATDDVIISGTCIDQTAWFVQAKQGWLVGTHTAEVSESTKNTEPRAYVWDGRYHLFGLFPIKVPLLPQKRKFVVRDGEPRGPIVLALSEHPPLTDYLPIGPARPTRWEVRDGDGSVVGSILVGGGSFSLIKLATKGQLYQDQHFWLDENKQKIGSVVIARSKFGLPGALIVQDNDGDEYASFGTAHGERFHADLKRAQQSLGGATEQKVNAPPKEEKLVEGVIGSVSPERVGDRYARLMTFGMTVLMQVIGVNKFTGAVSQAK